jgi:hypothetical protein
LIVIEVLILIRMPSKRTARSSSVLMARRPSDLGRRERMIGLAALRADRTRSEAGLPARQVVAVEAVRGATLVWPA